jgi:DNA topoisomerase I
LSLSRTLKPPYALVVCEKASAAVRIAQALGTSSFEEISGLKAEAEKKNLSLPPVFFATTKKGLRFVICSSIGHLYGLMDVKGNRSLYPVFDIKWMPIKKSSNEKDKKTPTLSELVINVISNLSRDATSFIHACDYDQEGEVIGYNILEYACNHKYEKSMRAKFSTLTDEEIRDSFDCLLQPSRRLAEAGRSRHMIDFIYGINLSRSLTESFKMSNEGKRYYNFSLGRVQGPTLAFVVDKEISIRNHSPAPYWTISAQFERSGYVINAKYYLQRINTISKATSIVDNCTNQDGRITEVKNNKVILKAPSPFNLGDLQKEAYRVFKFTPSYTLQIAEKLYLNALISYPRTSSQKLPSSINYRRIISRLSVIGPLTLGSKIKNNGFYSSNGTSPYRKAAEILLSKHYLFPNEGRKTDLAHPAIYPTGDKPKGRLDIAQLKLLDLIIKRFLATFGEPAVNQHTIATIAVKDDHIFTADENRTIYEGWMNFYKPYAIRSDKGPGTLHYILELYNGNILRNVSIMTAEKLIEPPHRFNQASLLEKMEKEKIGTKATRSYIINTLFRRNYIRKASPISNREQTNASKQGGIEATDIGFEIIDLMRKYVPKIVSTTFTRTMEEQLEEIESGKANSEFVIKLATAKLKEAITILKQREIELGNRITEAVNVMKDRQETVIGICPICSSGDLKIMRSKKTKKRFVGCSNYTTKKCNATAPLPQTQSIKTTGKVCTACNWPILEAVFMRQEKYCLRFCVNAQCPTKTSDNFRCHLSK